MADINLQGPFTQPPHGPPGSVLVLASQGHQIAGLEEFGDSISPTPPQIPLWEAAQSPVGRIGLNPGFLIQYPLSTAPWVAALREDVLSGPQFPHL